MFSSISPLLQVRTTNLGGDALTGLGQPTSIHLIDTDTPTSQPSVDNPSLMVLEFWESFQGFQAVVGISGLPPVVLNLIHKTI